MTCVKFILLGLFTLWAIPLKWNTTEGRADFKWITTPWNAQEALEGQYPQVQPHPFLRLSKVSLPQVFETQLFSLEGGIPFSIGQFQYGYRLLTQDNLRSINADGKETGTYSNDDQAAYLAWIHQLDSWNLYARSHYMFSKLDTYSSQAFWFDIGATYTWDSLFQTSAQLKQMGAGSSLISREIVLPLQGIVSQEFLWNFDSPLRSQTSLQYLYQNDLGHDGQIIQHLFWSDFARIQAGSRLRDFYWGLGGGLTLSKISLDYLYNSGELEGKHSFSITLFL